MKGQRGPSPSLWRKTRLKDGSQDAPFRRAFSKCLQPIQKFIQNETKNLPGISLFLLWKAWFWAVSFFPGGDPLSFLQQRVGASWLKQKLKEKAVRKLERVAAREQMLLRYKLGEDYAWPAVPYKCLVFTPRHDPLCLSYGPASGQFCPQLPYIYSNQAWAGDLFMYTIQSWS